MLQTGIKWYVHDSDSRKNKRYHACGHGDDHGHGAHARGRGAHVCGHGYGHDLLLRLHH